MTTIARARTRSHRHREVRTRRAPVAGAGVFPAPVGAAGVSAALAPVTNPHDRGGTVPFEIHITSSMTDADRELLRRRLDMTTPTEHKLPADPNSPGVMRPDHFSWLFLEHGAREDRSVLQARSWGQPAAATVHDWHVRAAQMARLLDPRVLPVERARGRSFTL